MQPIPYKTPHTGLTFLEYYAKHKTYHPGIDLNSGDSPMADLGMPIVSPVSALRVEYVSPEPTRLNSQNGGFGWFVILRHDPSNRWVRFAHLQRVNVAPGQVLKMGDEIGAVGATGTTSPHLHFEVWKPSIFETQRTHWRKFAYYPSGQSKAWVAEHYEDPLLWIAAYETSEASADWKQEAELYAELVGVLDVPALVASHPEAHRWILFVKKAIANAKK